MDFNFDSSDSPNENQQYSFDSQPLQSFDLSSNFSTDPQDFVQSSPAGGDFLTSLTSSSAFSADSQFSTDPNDFIPQSDSSSLNDFLNSPSENASYPPSNFSENYVPSPNFSLDPSDFIPPSELTHSNSDNSSYPPPLDGGFVAVDSDFIQPEAESINFNESPKPEESKPVSVYSSLSEGNDHPARIVEKNQILR